jgi:OmpA-OmpF porin, OOP family
MLSARRRACAAACALALVGLAPSARAQTTTFAVDRLVMAGAPGDGIAVWRPDLSDKTRFFGQLGLGLAVNPLRVDNYVDNLDNAAKIKGNPVSSQFTTYFNVGAEILGRVSLQVAFPLVAYQTGNPTNNTVVNLPQPAVSFKTTAPGDLRIEARVVVFRTEARDFKLALSGAAYVPTGDRYSFTGDAGPGGSFGFAAEYDAKVVAVTLNAAYRLRPTVALNELVVSSEVLYGLGIYVPLRRGTIRVGAEFFGGFGASPSTQPVNTTPPATRSNIGDLDTTPLEWMLNGRMFFTAKRQVYAGLGAGTRLTGGYAPDFRAVAVVGGSFGITDSDPRSPGSRYVFDTSDPTDTDHDGIPDEVDACPLEPGEMDSDPEKIGCPRYIRRVKGSNEIEVLKRIEFEFDKSTILPSSYPILDEVVNLLKVNPTIRKVVVEGHTDNQGTAEYNQKLSDDRAASVMTYLVGKGVEAGRLDSKGFGLTRPRATNDTDEGRQRNRRVEFHITEQSAEAPKK